MSEPSTKPGESGSSAKSSAPQGIEWLWWAVLVIALVTGFGMTIFAPT